MQSRPRSLPSRLTGAQSRGRGGVWSQRGGRRDGSDGNIPRRLPPDALAAAAAPADCTGGRARGTEAEEGAEEEAAGWDARGLGAFALPCPALPAWLVAGGSSSQGFAQEDVEAPDSGVRAPVLSLSREHKLCKRPGIGAFPKEKQTVTNALGARAPPRPLGSQRSSPASCTQTPCFQSLPDAPQGSRFHPLLPPFSLLSLFWTGSPHTVNK